MERARTDSQPAPLPVEPYLVEVRADYFAGQIDLKLFRARYPHYPVLSADPLLIEPERDCFVLLTKFGGLVSWGCREETVRTLRQEVGALPGSLGRHEEVEDSIRVLVGAKSSGVDFERVSLRKLTRENVKIVSLALAQSVALDFFENRIREVLAQTEPIVIRMRETGSLALSEKGIIQAVGFVMEVRANVLASLTLFDDPPEAWESAPIARLVTRLYDHFDLEERLSAIKEKVGYLTDLNSTFLNLLGNRKSRNLEWIVIVLIAIEIVLFFLAEFWLR